MYELVVVAMVGILLRTSTEFQNTKRFCAATNDYRIPSPTKFGLKSERVDYACYRKLTVIFSY